MTKEEILKQIDIEISGMSTTEAIDFLEDISADVDARIAGLECDLDNN